MTPIGQFRRECLPPPRAFYQREFGSGLGKERRNWAQTKCCFHDGKSKTSLSLNMDGGGFKCFSCGAHGGDLVAFVCLRYRVDFQRAAELLGAWDGTGSMSKSELRRQYAARAQQQAGAEVEVRRQHQERIAARDWLHLLERVYKQTNNRLSQLHKGDAERYSSDEETLWGILADCLPQIRSAATHYSELTGVTCVE